MEDQIKAIFSKMWDNDYFSQWLGIEVMEVKPAYCKARFTVRKEMLNGHGSIHGGVLFSVADSAFAFACNTQGKVAVALEVGTNFIKSAYEGETLTVVAQSLHHGFKTGVYDVRITNEKDELICLFKGTCYNTSKDVLGA